MLTRFNTGISAILSLTALLSAAPSLAADALSCKVLSRNTRCCVEDLQPTWWCDEASLSKAPGSCTIAGQTGVRWTCSASAAHAPAPVQPASPPPTAVSKGKLRFETLSQLIDSRNAGSDPSQMIRNPADLLKAIKDGGLGLSQGEKNEFFSRFAAMHTSRSRHAATLENPRVILRSADASFLMAIATAPNKAFSNVAEIIQFNPAKREFEFREILFPQDAQGNPAIPVDTGEAMTPSPSGQGVSYAAHTNQAGDTCFRCHSSRPNWDTYRIWPGAYKGLDDGELDHLTGNFWAYEREKAIYARAFVNGKFIYDHSDELAGYQALLRKFDSDPVLSQLSSFPYFSGLTPPDTNTLFTVTLWNQNAQRIARIVSESPGYSRYKYAMLAAYANCDDIESFVSASARNRSDIRSYPDLLTDTQGAHRAYFVDRWSRLLKTDPAQFPQIEPDLGLFFGANSDIEKSDISAKIRYVAQFLNIQNEGDKVEHWSTGPVTSFAFQNGDGSVYNKLFAQLATDVSKTDRDFAPFRNITFGAFATGLPEAFDGPGGVCAVLKRKAGH